jgi:hypothetical protein
MQDGIVDFWRKLFPFGLVSPKCNDPVNEDAQVNEHSEVLESQIVAMPSPIAVQNSEGQAEDGPDHEAVAN